MKFCLNILIVIGLCGFLHTVSNAQQKLLLTPTDRQGSVKPKEAPFIIRTQNVTADVKQVTQQENRVLTTKLPDGTIARFVKERQAQVAKRGLVWIGKIEKQPASFVFLSVVKDVLIGDIITEKGNFYQIRFGGNGVHYLREIQQSKLAPDGEPDMPKIKPRSPEDDPCATDPASDIDIMVIYTDDARSAAGGTDAIEAEMFLALEQTNQSYINSNINQRMRLVHIGEISYTETGNTTTDRNRLQNPGDGQLDTIHALRNTFAADLVAFIVESNVDLCGKAFIMNPVSTAFENFGFGVVIRDCATSKFSFGHEMGHIMSARHDWDADDTDNTPFHFNHGFQQPAPSMGLPWRTVMATTGGTRIPFWSNPGVNFNGDPTGTNADPEPTDNHQTLNNTAATVANFRCSSPATGNVWMKDTWNDTGLEPDPNTAGEAMWQSPYIWVRNEQDTTLIHQHQHQNPNVSSPTSNWVYVKLHNGGAAVANGNLEIYFAQASAGLSWPGDWTLLASVPVNGFAGHSTRIVEREWNPLPGTGHFCMIARWVSAADSMTVPETADINANTRNNNNIVWRNLNLVDMSGDDSEDAVFIMRNTLKTKAVNALLINGPKNEEGNSFFLHGQVSFRLDDVLLRAWRAGGSRGRGFKFTDGVFVVTDRAGAILTDFQLAASVSGKVVLNFRKKPTTPKRRYLVNAVQVKTVPANTTVNLPGTGIVGGVSYEIVTDKNLLP